MNEDRAGIIRGIANSIEICKLAMKGESMEDAIVRVGEDDGVTRDEVREVYPVEKAA